MVDLASLLSDEDLRRRYGTPTLDRAWDYVRHGHVLSCVHEVDSDGDLDIRGTVRGSTSAPYAVNVSVGVDGEGPWVFGRCSCPVHEGCKHVLALLITVRDEHARTAPAAGPPLGAAAVLAARRARRPGRALQPAADKPLALQVDLKPPARATGYRGWSAALPTATPARGTLRVRPAAARRPRQLGPHRGLLDRRALPRPARPPARPGRGAQRPAVRAPGRQPADVLRRRRAPDARRLRARRGRAAAARGRRRDAAGARAGAVAPSRWPPPVTLRLDVNAAPGHDAQLRLGRLAARRVVRRHGPRRAGGGRPRRRAVAGRGRALGGRRWPTSRRRRARRCAGC